MSIFTKIWNDLLGVFNEAKKLWNEFTTEEQAAVTDASGIIAIVNANLDKTPQVVFQLIQLKYPAVTEASLHTVLTTAATSLNIPEQIISPDFYTTLQNLQTYLSKFSGAAWESEVAQWVGIIATIFSPETLLQKIVGVLEYVYQRLVKPTVPTQSEVTELTQATNEPA